MNGEFWVHSLFLVQHSWPDVHENFCLSGSPVVLLSLCLDPRPPGCFGLGQEQVSLVFVSVFLNPRRGLLICAANSAGMLLALRKLAISSS